MALALIIVSDAFKRLCSNGLPTDAAPVWKWKSRRGVFVSDSAARTSMMEMDTSSSV
jgi:hypothetical protein